MKYPVAADRLPAIKPKGLICGLFLYLQLPLSFSCSIAHFTCPTGLFHIHLTVPPLSPPSLPLFFQWLNNLQLFNTKSKTRTAHRTHNRNKRHINCASSSKTFSHSFSLPPPHSRLVHRTPFEANEPFLWSTF